MRNTLGARNPVGAARTEGLLCQSSTNSSVADQPRGDAPDERSSANSFIHK
jgi:hypothetical protein